MKLDEILAVHPRVAVAGGPRTGKSTLVRGLAGRPVIATDQYMGLPWEQVPQAVQERLANETSFVVEGVQVARCLRKGLQVDCCVWLDRVWPPASPKQLSMGRGVLTVFQEWRQANRSVPVYRLDGSGGFEFMRV